MDSLLSSLLHFERSLKGDMTIRLTDEEVEAVVQRVLDSAPSPRTGRCTDIALVPVRTNVHQLTKSPIPGLSPSIVVPAFACHWGIVVGEPDHRKLYHLVFTDDTEVRTAHSNVKNQYIRFHSSLLLKPLPDAKPVGHTHYTGDELEALGIAMIREFGSYHRVFWNCQTFAKCYLRVITGKTDADFNDWTLADTSRLFLCAFLVGAPFATTNRVRENRRAEKLVKRIESIPANLSAEDRSAKAIVAMYNELKLDPSWGAAHGQILDTTEKPGFLEKLLTLLFGGK